MFTEYMNDISTMLLPREQFSSLPVYEDRAAWESLAPEHRARLIANGEKYLGYTWPSTPASVYMEFYRNGNRTNYESIVFSGRRDPLITLAVAECCEGKGRFIDDIINGLWATMEETTWVLPAHNNYTVKYEPTRPLPPAGDPNNVYIDLFAATCGAMVAWIYHVLGKRLGEVAAQVPERILAELEERIVYPFLIHKDFGWMGYHGGTVNNWNPWIVSNILTVAGFACTDEKRRATMVAKCLECVECFVKFYAPDGGCDEGPGYWNVAGSSLYDCVDILYDLTGGKLNLFDDQLVKNICTYIYKMHISDKYFVNYADAAATIYADSVQVYRMGKSCQDEKLRQMGVASYQLRNARIGQDPKVGDVLGTDCTYRTAKKLQLEAEIAAQPATAFPFARDVWFDGIQVMAARMNEGCDCGLYLSAKGGTNDESHNHNDIGSFVVFCDGKPVAIDIGTGVYEKKTFSPQRYEILQIQSNYHNVPMVNGLGQVPGMVRAEDVAYSCTDDAVTLTENLRQAYPAEAGVQCWKRGFTFDRKAGTVTVADEFALENEAEVQLSLITKVEPTFTEGEMTVTVDGTSVAVAFDPAVAHVTEHFRTEHDARLSGSWGPEGVYRTVFTLPGKVQSGKHAFVFKKI